MCSGIVGVAATGTRPRASLLYTSFHAGGFVYCINWHTILWLGVGVGVWGAAGGRQTRDRLDARAVPKVPTAVRSMLQTSTGVVTPTLAIGTHTHTYAHTTHSASRPSPCCAPPSPLRPSKCCVPRMPRFARMGATRTARRKCTKTRSPRRICSQAPRRRRHLYARSTCSFRMLHLWAPPGCASTRPDHLMLWTVNIWPLNLTLSPTL